jgi:hypothetical protein
MLPRVPAFAATALLGATLLLAAPAARAQTFDFEGVSFVGTPFTLTSGGVSATFSDGGRQFFRLLGYPRGTLAGLSGQVLGDASTVASPLTIDFDVPLSAIALNFALLGGRGTGLTLAAFRGLAPVGGTAAPADPNGPSAPEGAIAFGGAVFDRVVLLADEGGFAIDNVAAAASPVPEPATAGLVGAALGILAVAARGRRRRR